MTQQKERLGAIGFLRLREKCLYTPGGAGDINSLRRQRLLVTLNPELFSNELSVIRRITEQEFR
jgi:hypothetical protein